MSAGGKPILCVLCLCYTTCLKNMIHFVLIQLLNHKSLQTNVMQVAFQQFWSYTCKKDDTVFHKVPVVCFLDLLRKTSVIHCFTKLNFTVRLKKTGCVNGWRGEVKLCRLLAYSKTLKHISELFLLLFVVVAHVVSDRWINTGCSWQ